MRHMRRLGLVASTAVPLILAATDAAAQAVRQGGSDTTQLDEIVITATRREETLRDVPISVSAFSQELMDKQGIRDVGDIARLTPGVTFNQFGSLGSSISIRGISSGAGAATVGIYIDDTPIQQRATIASGNFSSNAYPQVFDLERVEVLRGPQGTLFGASSQGGTIRFITPTPSVTTRSAYARGEIATTKGGAESYEAGVALGGPIVDDKLGFRASVWHRRDGGFVDHLSPFTGRIERADADEQRTLSARLAFAFKPNDALTLEPSIFFQKTKLDDTRAVYLPVTDPRFTLNYTDLDATRFGQAYALAQPFKQSFVLPALRVNYAGPMFDVISNTSYYRRKESGITDFTPFEVPLWTTIFTGRTVVLPTNPHDVATGFDDQRSKFFTQEVRLQSNKEDARVDWTIGAFFARNEVETFRSVENTFLGGLISQALPPGVCTPATCLQTVFGVPLAQGRYVFVGNTTTVDKQLSGFGQVDVHITERLTLTAGVRVAHSKFSFENVADGPVNGPPAPRTDVGSTKETPITPKIGLSYKTEAGDLFYATVADGFRIGGANVPVNNPGCAAGLAALGLSAVPTDYKSDRARSYEAGAKVALADGRVRLDGSVFLIKWKNRIGNVQIPNGCPLAFTDNLGDVTSYGFDLLATVKPVDSLTLSLAIGDAKATYDKDYFPVAGQVKPTVSEGDAIDGSRLTATLSAEYEFTLPGETQAYVRGDYTYTGKNDRTPSLNPANASFDAEDRAAPALEIVNARAGVYLGDVEVSVFVDNLFNENHITDLGAVGLGSPIHTGFVSTRPRTMGVTASYRY